jgi:beta-phosphoglucomutase-like phosphatase (HAD superfamily)
MVKELAVDPRARGLIFDLDGTLVDSMPLHYEAWKEVCALKGLNFTEEEFYSLAGVPSDRIFEIINERHGTDFDPQKHSKLKEDTYLKKINKLQPVEPVFQLAIANYGKLPMAMALVVRGNIHGRQCGLWVWTITLTFLSLKMM